MGWIKRRAIQIYREDTWITPEEAVAQAEDEAYQRNNGGW